MNPEQESQFEYVIRWQAEAPPASYQWYEDMRAAEHVTFVCPVSGVLADRLTSIYDKPQLSDFLHFNPEDRLHLTLVQANRSAAETTGRIIPAIRQFLASEQRLRFHCKGVVAGPGSVALCAFPYGNTYDRLRDYLELICGIPQEEGIRGHLRWIAVGRYRKPSTPELLDELNYLKEEDFGEFCPDEILAYQSRDRVLADADLLGRIPLG